MVIQNNFLTQLKRGIDENIVVFDSEAKEGFLTKRLIYLMKIVARKNGKRLSSILAEDVLETENNFLKFVADDGSISVAEVQVKFIKSDITDIYTNKLGGSVSYQDKYVIIGVCADNKIILGSC